MKQQKGFTLVELIVVIAILGILAAYAVPKFISVESNARNSVLDATLGAAQSATQMVHALALVENKATQASGEFVTIDGTRIDLKYGYPSEAGANNLSKALTLSDDINYDNSNGRFSVANGGNDCYFTYNPATSATSGVSFTKNPNGCQ